MCVYRRALNVEFVKNRTKLQYAIKSKQQVTKLHKISKNTINNKEKNHTQTIVQSNICITKYYKLNMNIHVSAL